MNVRESRDLQLNQFQHYHLYLGRYLLFLTFSIVQALIMCLGDLYLLEIQCPAPGRFILTGILAAVTFSNIVYTLTISLGDVGKAAAIVLLIIQVAGAGGTFPVELTPSFFNELNPFMPFTHGNQCHEGMHRRILRQQLCDEPDKDVCLPSGIPSVRHRVPETSHPHDEFLPQKAG